MEFNKIKNLLGPAHDCLGPAQGLLRKNGLKFKVNLEVLTVQVNQ